MNQSTNQPLAFNYIADYYQLFQDSLMIQYLNEKTIGIYNFNKDPSQKNNLLIKDTATNKSYTKKLKAIIQTYNNGLIDNSFYQK